ncbi:NCA2-domain-containing protein [Exidia glandulosa HHB12029]|uniref:NCA2-domain-containing protein n=1 Tax=Exidia glandulosa HHB12029 TaxID=1314781 RepID=A0A165ZW30_EXIGL|nr:NCA2-domain-containing protein [Exidia glandulosa HHB12029]
MSSGRSEKSSSGGWSGVVSMDASGAAGVEDAGAASPAFGVPAPGAFGGFGAPAEDIVIWLLQLARPQWPTRATSLQTRDVPREKNLNDLYVQFSSQDHPASSKRDQIATLGEIVNPADGDLERSIYAAASVSIYEDAMAVVLSQALEIENEMGWWADVEASRWDTLYYFVSMLPVRLLRAVDTIFTTLRDNGIPLSEAVKNPGSVLSLLQNTVGPSALRGALYPRASKRLSLPASPLTLSRAECAAHRRELEALRDERAELLGLLARMRTSFNPQAPMPFIESIKAAFVLEKAPSRPNQQGRARAMSLAPPTLSSTLRKLALVILPAHQSAHADSISDLKRPHTLVRVWPELLLAPPLVWAGFHYAAGLRVGLRDAVDTIKGFWSNYVVAPAKEILDTVRTGGDDRIRIVSPEALKADMESLQRMAEALARDKLSYTPEQLAQLGAQVRAGDLGPVLRVYEEELKTPVKSALGGSLVRALLIQVQKTKVDLDVAMNGIDKLLRSQELTFAFVGVAPSLAILYGVGGWLLRVWNGGRGGGRYGGLKRRADAFVAARRVERLLLQSPEAELSALTQGLLLLSLNQLRAFGESSLPKGSRIREGFLQDVEDLESTDDGMGRSEKLAVVARLWRSWGNALGWNAMR